MAFIQKDNINTYIRIATGGENITFVPSVNEDYFSLALKNRISLELAGGYKTPDSSYIIEKMEDADGFNNYINVGNTTASFDGDSNAYYYFAADSVIETIKVADTAETHQALLVSEVFGTTNNIRSRIEVSLNDGLNWNFTDAGNYKYADDLIDIKTLPKSLPSNNIKLKIRLYLNSGLTLPASLNTWNYPTSAFSYSIFFLDVYNRMFFAINPTNMIFINNINVNDPSYLHQKLNLISYAQSSIATSGVYSNNACFYDKSYGQYYQLLGTDETANHDIAGVIAPPYAILQPARLFKNFNYISSTWSNKALPSDYHYLAHANTSGTTNSGFLHKGITSFRWLGATSGDMANVTYETSMKYWNGTTWAISTPHPNSEAFVAQDSNSQNSNDLWITGNPISWDGKTDFALNTSYSLYNWNGISWSSKTDTNIQSKRLTGNSSSLFYMEKGTGSTSAFSKYDKITDTHNSLAIENLTTATYKAFHQIGYTAGNVWMSCSGWSSSNFFTNGSLGQYLIHNESGLKGFGIKLIR